MRTLATTAKGRNVRLVAALVACLAAMLLPQRPWLRAQEQPSGSAADTNMAPADAIKGEMNMTFNTRTAAGTEDGAPRKGVKDVYSVNLTINGNRQIVGQITRQPRIKQLRIRTVQQPQYDFDLKWVALLRSGPKTVGNWIGVMPVDEQTGAFILDGAGDPQRAMRIAIDVGQAFTDQFGGRFYGKPEDKTKLNWETFKRTVQGKTVEYKYQADPMRFDGLILAEGPDKGRYTRCVVNGSLDYDRATGNYFAKNLRMSYVFDGKEYNDTITGTIKWVEDPNRASNGKGRYEFNLRFNEEKHTKAAPEEAVANIPDEDAIFAVDKHIPAITGTIDYVDNFGGSVLKDPDGRPLPTTSKAVYNLQANGLTKQQTMNFAKLWLIAVGPTNDE
ncbi:hypothetical protein [Fontivita pretiosa]|uniref:hypothetical protein n=1 Tax=Fontivita pretiosa TaxID=2989684 RepID=UPI003D185C28